jgi:uncharacterized protein
LEKKTRHFFSKEISTTNVLEFFKLGCVMKILDMICSILLIIGGLNWGLVGVADFDLVAMIFGAGSMLSRLVYCLVGLSAVYKLYSCCGCCSKSGKCDR